MLTVIYTANLRADFALMARVFTTIKAIRQHYVEQATLLLDIGGVWSADSWVCQATENRAPYLILDAMGYAVARADGLDTGAILGLQPIVQMRLLDDSVFHQWIQRGITVQIGPKGQGLGVTWGGASASDHFYEIASQRLTLYPLDRAIGVISLIWPDFSVIAAEHIPFDLTARPDPTITAAIEFVEREALFYQQNRRE